MVNVVRWTPGDVAKDAGNYVAAVDVGTTRIKCHVYDKEAKVCGSAQRQVELLYPKPTWVEINPEELWAAFVNVIKEAIHDANLTPQDIGSIGISTQRATFTTWDRKTGKRFHNFITWKDLRAEKLVKMWNKSWTMMVLRTGAKALHSLTRRKRFLAASVLQFHSRQVLMRLLWALDNVPELREAANTGEALFGMIETWLVWKLTDGKVHVTDYSCASATAMFDPFVMSWGEWALRIFKIPPLLLPEVKDTSGFFGMCEPEIFGAAIPILSLVGDQQAAMFGECCFNKGDVNVTLGTGSFLDVNTGSEPHASVGGLYPLVGWKIGDEVTYMAEGLSNDTGTAINWLQSVSLLNEPAECNDLAESVDNTGGVYFVPAFSGLQAPLNDNRACAGFLGISAKVERPHLVRAVLESLAFRVHQLFDVLRSEADFPLANIRVDGGVANCDFLLQLLADLTNLPLERPTHVEMSCLGAAFLAGLASGMWKSKEDLKILIMPEKIFIPREDRSVNHFKEWKRAVQRCSRWYKDVK